MIRIRPAAARGATVTDWLDSRHTFSFNQYYDPEHMGFRSLRVINDDRVAPGAGFPRHGHRDMEILTWVLSCAIAHQDSTGATSVLRPGEVQCMSAGRGITHSEYNYSSAEPLHFLQIWIVPREKGIEPGYQQRPVLDQAGAGRLVLMVSPDGRDGSARISQDAEVYVARLAPGGAVSRRLGDGRHAWLHVARGTLTLNGHTLAAGDGAAVSGESGLDIQAAADSEFLLFDLA